MKEKAQGAIEYLLLIGAAILVVAVVIGIVVVMINQGQEQGNAANDTTSDQLTRLNKIKADKINLANYDYSGPDYLKTISFVNETNCTIRKALQSMQEEVPGYKIYLGGNSVSYCGIGRDGENDDSVAGRVQPSGRVEFAPPDCDAKLKTSTDYNIQVYLETLAPLPNDPPLTGIITWTAYCD
jgi:hypothetical protein